MTQFGQDLLPRIYEDNTTYQFTKTGFVNHLARALVTVGMVPVTSVWPYDAIGVSDLALADGTYVFLFDYPDDGNTVTFNVNQTLYRPCLLVVMYIGDQASAANPTRLANYVLVHPAIRPSGSVSLADVRHFGTERGTTGDFNLGLLTSTYSTIFPSQAGHEIQLATWKVHTASVALDQDLLSVGHFFLYLGPAGLSIYVGTGNERQSFGDLMAVHFGFGGARIPGRALPVLEDGDLNRINPVVPFFFRSAGSLNDVFDTNPASEFFQQFRAKIHGIQEGLKFTTIPVDSWVFNLANIEYPIFPTYRPHTVPSPIQISTGGGGHILGRVIHVPDSREDDDGDLYGPIEPQITANDVRPRFEDVFDLPGCRWCDVSAPVGLTTDPNTLLDWYLFPTYNSDGLFAVLVEPNVSGTITSTLDTLTLTPSGSDYYNLTGANGWGNTFPTPVTITETGTSTTVWDDASVADEQTFTVPGSPGTQNYQVQWVVEVDAADPLDTLYEVTFDAFNRDDPQSGGQNAEGFNPLLFQYQFNGTWTTTLVIECAGANVAYVNTEGEQSYNLANYGAFVTRDTTGGTPVLRLRWNVQSDTSRGCAGAVGNVRINKFRYL